MKRTLSILVTIAVSFCVPARTVARGSKPRSTNGITETAGRTLSVPAQERGGIDFNVKAYGASGNGKTDDTLSINVARAAAEAAHGTLYFPPGDYKFKGLTISTSSITVRGDGPGATRLRYDAATGDSLTIDASSSRDQVVIRDLTFEPLVPRRSGNELRAPFFSNLHLDNLSFQGYYQALDLGQLASPSGIVYASNIRAYGATLRFAWLKRVVSAQFSHCAIDTATAGGGGFLLDGGVESAVFWGVDIANSFSQRGKPTGNAITFQNTIGYSTPARFNKFFGSYFDSHAYGVFAHDGVDNEFQGCWFSDVETGVVITGTASDYRFVGGGARNCGSNGFYLGGSGPVTMTGTDAVSNNSNRNAATAVASAGVVLDLAGPGSAAITGGRMGNSDAFGNVQSYAIWITANPSMRFTITGVNALSNGAGAINNLAGTGAQKIIANVLQ